MVDHVDFTPGTGGTLATDEIAGVHYPRTKLIIGDDGVNDGDVSINNPLPVGVVGGSMTVSVTPGAEVVVTNFPANTEVFGAVSVSNLPSNQGQQAMAGSVPVVLASDQSAVPVTAASLPLPTGAATEATLGGVLTTTAFNTKTPDLITTVPFNGVSAPPVRTVGQDVWTCSFASVGSSVLSSDFGAPIVGTGVGYSQASGSLLITTGTSTNAEFLTRSVTSWRGSMRLRASIVASQRIAQNNLMITLADLFGEGLSVTINSAVSITVTKTAHGLTAQNVGQFMFIGGIVGAAGVPGRYAIASVPTADTVNFTVAGWPASGSCTATLFGWNHVKNLVTGVTATQIAWDAQRRGWATGDTTATINTTASLGTIIQNDLNGRDAFLMDSLRATSTIPTFTTRASRYENLPDDDVTLYVFIWSYNGTSAPASTTTWTLGFISVEKFANTPVYIQGNRSTGAANSLPTTVNNTVTTTVASIGAGSSAIGDVGIQYRANATGAATLANLSSPATPAAQAVKASAGRLLSITATNTNAAARWIKLWNTASGSVTLGTTAAIAELAIPPNQTVQFNLDGGIAFSTAITMAVTGGQGLTNNTAITLGDVTGLIAYA